MSDRPEFNENPEDPHIKSHAVLPDFLFIMLPVFSLSQLHIRF